MCILALAWLAHPRWRLVVAGNRDELHARPAAPLARWGKPDHLIAGRDLEAGGTWLGVSEQGCFAVLTNLRGYGPPQPGRASRGALVTDLLAGEGAFADADGIDLARYGALAGRPPSNLADLEAMGLIARDDRRIAATAAGRRVLNSLIAELSS